MLNYEAIYYVTQIMHSFVTDISIFLNHYSICILSSLKAVIKNFNIRISDNLSGFNQRLSK